MPKKAQKITAWGFKLLAFNSKLKMVSKMVSVYTTIDTKLRMLNCEFLPGAQGD